MVGGDAYALDATDKIVPGVEVVDYFYTETGSAFPNAWGATINPAGANVSLVIEAICANASSTSVGRVAARSGGAKPAKPLE